MLKPFILILSLLGAINAQQVGTVTESQITRFVDLIAGAISGLDLEMYAGKVFDYRKGLKSFDKLDQLQLTQDQPNAITLKDDEVQTLLADVNLDIIDFKEYLQGFTDVLDIDIPPEELKKCGDAENVAYHQFFDVVDLEIEKLEDVDKIMNSMNDMFKSFSLVNKQCKEVNRAIGKWLHPVLKAFTANPTETIKTIEDNLSENEKELTTVNMECFNAIYSGQSFEAGVLAGQVWLTVFKGLVPQSTGPVITTV
jgi:hypothetical protein